MKRRSCLLLSLCWWALLLQGCSPSEADLAEECTVNFTVGMQMTGEWEPGEWVTRATAEPLAEGTTVRVLIYKGGSTAAADYLKECTYKVVSGGSLVRCAVNADGTVNNSGTVPAAPTVIKGTYTFYAVSPAVTVNHTGYEPTASVTHGMDVAVAKQVYAVTIAANGSVPLTLTRFCCRLNFITDREGTAVNNVVVQSVTLTDMSSTPKTLTGTTALDNTVSSTASVTVPGSAFVTDVTSAWKQTGHTFVLPKQDAGYELEVSAKINNLSVVKVYDVSMVGNFAPGTAYNFTLKFNGIDMEVIQNDQWEDVPEGGDVFGNSNNLSKNGTANCYIVTSNTAQEYRFDARVRGNGYESITDPNVSSISYGTLPSLYDGTVARVIWQTGTDASTLLIDPASLKLQYGKVYFKTTGKINEGNAVIGIFASSADTAPCLWSWHIWKLNGSVPADVACAKYLNGNTGNAVIFQMMALNLGAFNNTPGNANSIGLYYQWGRKDPFPGPQGFNDNEPSNIYGSYNVGGNTTGKWAGTYSMKMTATSASVGTEAWAVQYPTAFITSASDWLITKKNSLWGTPWKTGGYNEYNGNQGTKSIYDPCPLGYRVPPQDFASKANFGALGYLTDIVPSGSFWFPAAGGRSNSDGSLATAGGYGRYFVSSPYDADGVSAGRLYLSNEEGSFSRYALIRSYGGSIRCAAE